MNRNRAIAQQAGQRERRLTRFPSSTSLAAAALPWTFGFCLLHYPVHSFLLQQKLEAILMEKRPLGLPDLLVSGSWYAIPAIWAFFAFVRMALGLGDKFLIACLVGTAAVFVWFIGQTLLQWGRAGKQPTDEQQRAAIGAMWGPVFSVIWAGFVAGCSASMIVVIELNDPFSKEAVDRVVQEHPILYWAVAGAGLVPQNGIDWPSESEFRQCDL